MSPAVLPTSHLALNASRSRKSRRPKARRTSALLEQLAEAPPPAVCLLSRASRRLYHLQVCPLHRAGRPWSVPRKWSPFGSYPPSSSVSPINIASAACRGQKLTSKPHPGKSSASSLLFNKFKNPISWKLNTNSGTYSIFSERTPIVLRWDGTNIISRGVGQGETERTEISHSWNPVASTSFCLLCLGNWSTLVPGSTRSVVFGTAS